MNDLKKRLHKEAARLGFDRIGVTTADPPHDYNRYLAWIAAGNAADLWYMTETTRREKRGDLRRILPGARSVIVGAISYKPTVEPPSSDAKIARYAAGEDYHPIVSARLEALAEWLKKNSPEPFDHRVYVDTGPILERSLAERAGVGWIGKNSCVMHESTGSYIFLGEILTTLPLSNDSPATFRCGSCTRCLDACPTGAIVAPFQLDSNRCISYHTLESQSDSIPDSVAGQMKGWIAGCDICQEVCPWNDDAPPTLRSEFQPKSHALLTRSQIESMREYDFNRLFEKTTLKRLGRKRIQRNINAARHVSGVG